MLITNHAFADKIVEKFNNLMWDGWDIVELLQDPSAEYNANGVRINNKWYTKKIYPVLESGWEVPTKYVR